jgi:bifunctional UDP-N-acetylglucosamine pyrophosphorylase/glucosamine-1-phosphate N-acetyltransferase
MNTTCVILAAGQGKRMRSKIPKVLHEVCGEPMIWYPVSLALSRDWSPVVVISKQGGNVRAFLEGRFGEKVRFGVQDPPLGTGHALMSVREQFHGSGSKAIILYGDVPLLSGEHLDALLRGAEGTSVAFLSCRLTDPSGYGRVVRDERGEVTRIVEHRDATPEQRAITEVNTGIYLIDEAFLL